MSEKAKAARWALVFEILIYLIIAVSFGVIMIL